MKKVLGLDIGTNSIGWALVYEDDDQNSDILDMGVRIVASDSTHATEFEKGQPITLNAKRRVNRGIRRGNQRYKHRHQQLLAALKALDMMPDDVLLRGSTALHLYGLRDKAVQGEKLSLAEIGRIFIQLSQKRGYKSNRKANNDAKEQKESNPEAADDSKPEKKKGYLDLIQDREALIKNNGITIGQFFYENLKNTEGGNFRVKQQIFMRQSYMNEFDLIWEKQKAFHPTVLTEQNLVRFRDEILYYQRRLKSQKHLITNCRFEERHKAIPRSAPLYQTFNVWQIVNNIKITNPTRNHSVGKLKFADDDTPEFDIYNERRLSDKERKLVFEYLDNNKEALPRKVFKEILSLNPSDNKLNYEKLEGNKTKSRLKIVGDNILNNPDKLNDLWHKMYSIEESEVLIQSLQKTFGFDEALAKAVAKINLQPDYGSVSAKAIRRLMPHLEKGMVYSDACKAVFNENPKLTQYNTAFVTKVENMQRELAKQITLIERGALRNPVVEQIVNQVVNLVNTIIGTPQYLSDGERESGEFEIRVELARELKANAEVRQKATSNIRKNREKNEQIVNELKKIDVRITQRNIEKYKLWEEQGKVSPYTFQPIAPIPLAKLFDENMYEIEHVIPRARFFDDSMNNKVIAETAINREKNKMTGYEYMESKGKLAEYIKFVNDTRGFSKGKRERLLSKTVPEDFISRQLKETQYVTKAVVEKLKEACHNVYVSSGTITDYLRENWGMNELMQKLNWKKYEAMDLVYEVTNKDGKVIKRIKDWTKRDDHRHHAIDALIVAFTRQGIIQSLNSLNAQHLGTYNEFKERGRKFPEPMPGFVARAMEMADRILISHRQKRKVMTRHTNTLATGHKQVTSVPRGQLHKESVYGKIKKYEMVELSARFRNWNLIADEPKKALVMQRLNEAKGDPSVAFKNYNKNPIWLDDDKTKPLLHVPVWKEEFVLKYALNDSFKEKDAEFIVDFRIKELVRERFKQCGGDPKKAFREPLYFDENRKIAITSVRCFTGLSNLIALHDNRDFVQSGNNHHLAIYENEEGKKDSDIVSFWTAVERKRQGVGVLQPTHPEKGKLVQTFAINDIFIIGLDPSVIDIFDEKNYREVSKCLYRVQKLSDFDIFFRHHLETNIDDKNVQLSKEMKKFYRANSIGGFDKLNAVKVKLNNLGKIERII